MKCIIACDINGGIGYKNKLPWDRIEGDLPRFKQLTENKIIVMGRNTWESLPVKPLPKRTNIVISNTMQQTDDIMVLPNIGKLKKANDVWVIGGAKLIESVWSSIQEIYLTSIFTEYTCDTHINLVTLERDFNLVSVKNYTDHSFKIYKRKHVREPKD